MDSAFVAVGREVSETSAGGIMAGLPIRGATMGLRQMRLCQPSLQPVERCWLVFKLHGEGGCEQRHVVWKGMWQSADANGVLLRGDEGGGASGERFGGELVQVSDGEAAVVRECTAQGEPEPLGFKPGEKLRGAGDAAEGGDGAGDGRNFHAAADAPDGAGEAAGAELGFEAGIFSGDSDDMGAGGGAEGFAQVAGGEQRVPPVFAVEEQDVDVAMELAVLEAVVEKMHQGYTTVGERTA